MEVALLLTDVEGSTGLLVRQGPAGVEALERVATIVAEGVERHGGRVCRRQGEGDSALAVFPSTLNAVAASVSVNELIASAAWPGGERVAVRSAVHLGRVIETAEGVFGLEVHRCARLRSLVSGGEVVLSAVAARHLEHRPSTYTLHDEGVVALRGFPEPERVWRLAHRALQPRRGPLRTVLRPLAALPMWRTSFVGRQETIEAVRRRPSPERVVTLAGPAGVGKTRLAVAVAETVPLRAVFVDLTAASVGADVLGVVGAAVGADAAESDFGLVEALLSAAPAVVVVDNCEHVIDAAAAVCQDLAERCAGSLILATSRRPLRVVCEDVVEVAGLATGAGGAAVELFVHRARGLRPDFQTGPAELRTVGSVVEWLGGVPLTIELAAAQLSAMSLDELAAGLRRALGDLADVRHSGPSRHHSVQGAVRWSLALLDERQRAALARLSVLPGPFRLTSADAVLQSQPAPVSALSAVPELVEQSLVTVQGTPAGSRYRIQETIRVVAAGELTSDQRTEVLDALLRHCVDLAARADADDVPAEPISDLITEDRALFAAAVAHATTSDQVASGLRMVYDLFNAWHGRSHRWILNSWMSALLARADAPSRERGGVLRRQAIIVQENGDADEADRLLERAAADARAIGDGALAARVLTTAGGMSLNRGLADVAEVQLLEAVALAEPTADEFFADTLLSLADFYFIRADLDQAEVLLDRAATVSQARWTRGAKIEQVRGWCTLVAGQIDAAARSAVRTLALAEQAGNVDLIAHAVELAAYAELARGRLHLSEALFRRLEALSREAELDNLRDALTGLTIVAVLTDASPTAQRCREELEREPEQFLTLAAYRRLACGFSYLGEGDTKHAETAVDEAMAIADRLGQRYVRILSLELSAAVCASHDRQQSRRYLAIASHERERIGARPWPLEPYRDFAQTRWTLSDLHH